MLGAGIISLAFYFPESVEGDYSTVSRQGQNSFVERNLKSLFEFSMAPLQSAAARLDWAIVVTVNDSAESSLLDARNDTEPYPTVFFLALPANLCPP